MPRLFKWGAILIGGLVVLTAAGLVAAYFVAEDRLKEIYEVAPEEIAIPEDEASIERGRRLAAFVRCQECHGRNLSGEVFLESPVFGRLVAANLTSGKGGIAGQFTDQDWVNALRHGIGPDRRSLIITPAVYYYYMNDSDLGALVAYVKSVRPVDRELPPTSLGPLARVFLLVERTWLPAERIDHTAARPVSPEPGVTVEYGKYLVQIGNCEVCHGNTFQLAGWTESDFVTAMRSGRIPGGGALDNDYMPWRNTSGMTDEELRAIWLYLQSIQ